MTTIYLVRHAHAEWSPDENRPLSPRGYADALRVAEVLGREPIAAIHASPALRARQTVTPLAERLSLPILTEPGLEERRLGAIGETPFLQAVAATWRDPLLAYPQGEYNAAAQERGTRVLECVLREYPQGHVVLATHGNLLALILQSIDPAVDLAFWESLTMPDVYRARLNEPGGPLVDRLWMPK